MKGCSILLTGFILCCTSAFADLPDKTPLEASAWLTLPDSEAIDQFLKQLEGPFIKKVSLGKTAGNRNFSALFISTDPAFYKNKTHTDKITVLITGSLHATEYSGSEALQRLALNFASGELGILLDHMNIILIVNGNPDGRDLHSRFNQNGINLNTDYIFQTQPETRMIAQLLREFKPDALLDMHESSMKKRILTKEQGYIKDVEAQYETGNNPDIDSDILDYARKVLMPELLQISEKNGLSGTLYKGETLSLQTPVSAGGLKISNLRNYSALNGCFSFLVENRMDLRNGNWPTPENIKARSEKQYISALSFLNLVQQHKKDIREKTSKARTAFTEPLVQQTTLKLYANWTLNPQKPWAPLQLIDVKTGEHVIKLFPNHTFLNVSNSIPLPQAYAVTAQTQHIAQLLDLHQIQYSIVEKPQEITGMPLKITLYQILSPQNPHFSDKLRVEGEEIPGTRYLKKGDLIIKTQQPAGKLAVLLLDPRSMNSIYVNKTFRPLIKQEAVFPMILDEGLLTFSCFNPK